MSSFIPALDDDEPRQHERFVETMQEMAWPGVVAGFFFHENAIMGQESAELWER
jgi:hypothetical protein